ncbi:claudin-4-like [Electrophorus electricus]|uniref:Claudin-4-like n=1 Tax=Electrophorus electricus TaxID=8005 RepID=A0A4W4FV41_ELEEL|nr:claudin-4-like [Electrophorus electricus]
MASMSIQLLGCILALIGWVGVIIVCALPMWRVTAFIGSNIVTAQIIWEGIWMSCVVQSTGQMQCKVYDSMLALSTDLQAARALVVVSLLVGLIGLCITFVAGKCTNFITVESSKNRTMLGAGVLLVISGILCLIPVSWSASTVIRDFYNPVMVDAQRRELGASLYIGWGAGLLMILGGALLCSSCPPSDNQGSSLKYQPVKKPSSILSHTAPPLRSGTPTSKTYI